MMSFSFIGYSCFRITSYCVGTLRIRKSDLSCCLASIWIENRENHARVALQLWKSEREARKLSCSSAVREVREKRRKRKEKKQRNQHFYWKNLKSRSWKKIWELAVCAFAFSGESTWSEAPVSRCEFAHIVR